MPIEPHKLADLAMSFMEELEAKYPDDADIEALAFVVAIDRGNETVLEYRFRDGDGNTASNYVARGLLAEVDRGLQR